MAAVKTARKKAKKTPIKTKQAKSRKTAEHQKLSEKKETSLDTLSGVGVDFLGIKLTALRKAFIIYYVIPGQPCYQNALKAALKAGYSQSVAISEIYRILRDPDMQRIIKANEELAYQTLHAAAMRALQIKIIRANFDPIDYYDEKEEIIDVKGVKVKKKS